MLTDIKLKQAAIPPVKPYKLYDRDGLLVIVHPNGSKYWRYKYSYDGKEKQLALGVYPDVSLAMARQRRDDSRQLVIAGIDPSEHRQEQKLAKTIDRANVFGTVATEWLAVRSKTISEQSLGNVQRRLTSYVLPDLADIPVSKIDAPAVLAVIRKLEATDTLETARRVRQDIGQILRFASATGRKATDVTATLRGATVPVRVKHRPAITSTMELSKLIRDIWRYDGLPVIRSALKLLPMLLVRPGELAGAEWSEIDQANGLWLIPAGRMKMKTDHIVPLPRQALAILAEVRQISGTLVHVFPNRRRCVAPMDRTSLSVAFTRMGYSGKQTAHGLRATARTIMDEVLGVRTEYIEMQLAHAVKDPNGQAYNRTTFLQQRASMLQSWADYLDSLRID